LQCGPTLEVRYLARYLLVLVDSSEGQALVATASRISVEDPTAQFVLIVPTAPLSVREYLLAPYSSATYWARVEAQRLRARFVAAGIAVEAVRLGNADPAVAISDALRFSKYSAVVVACAPHLVKHAMHRDLAGRMAKRFPGVGFVATSARDEQRSMAQSEPEAGALRTPTPDRQEENPS
jgi:hypothetical protein